MRKLLCPFILLAALFGPFAAQAISQKECARLVSNAAVDSLGSERLLSAITEFGRNTLRFAVGLPAITSANAVEVLHELGLAHIDAEYNFVVDVDLRNLRIADVGAGRSNFGAVMNSLESQTGTHVVSIDHANLDGAVPGSDFVQGDVLDLPLESERCDLTVSRALISYFLPLTSYGWTERKIGRLHKALFEMIRITRDGGEVRFTFSAYRHADMLVDILLEHPRVESTTMKSGPNESMIMVVRLKDF